MKKFIFFFIFMNLFLFLTTGCTSYVELDHLDIVENLGIDYLENHYQITATTIQKSEEKYVYKTLTSTGTTLEEAIDAIKVQEMKKFYIAHLDLLILTPNAVNQKLKDILNFFLQNSESRNDFSMAISENLEFLKEDEDKQFREMIQIVADDTGTTQIIQFEEFLKDLLDKNFSYLPVIQIKEKPEANAIMIIQNYQVRDHLTKEECILYNLLTNQIKQANLFQNTILSNQTSTRFQKSKMKITMDAILLSKSYSKDDFEKQVIQGIEEMFEKYKKKKIDIFNFEKQIEISNNKFYKSNQKDLLDKIKLDFDIESKTDTEEKKDVRLP